MKRVLFILMLIFVLTGCSKDVSINGDVTEIKYNGILINDSDYDYILDGVNGEYKSGNDLGLKDTLVIKTKEDIYSYALSDKYIGYNNMYMKDDKLNKFLKKCVENYKDTSFFTVDYKKDDSISADDSIILDKSSNFIVINFKEKVTNFKINEMELNNHNFTDVDLLYSKDEVDVGDLNIRKSINYEYSDIKISFVNKHNYKVVIIPKYDEKGEAYFKISINPQ